jgi:hypothetical protein
MPATTTTLKSPIRGKEPAMKGARLNDFLGTSDNPREARRRRKQERNGLFLRLDQIRQAMRDTKSDGYRRLRVIDDIMGEILIIGPSASEDGAKHILHNGESMSSEDLREVATRAAERRREVDGDVIPALRDLRSEQKQVRRRINELKAQAKEERRPRS